MSPAEIEGLIALGTKLFGVIAGARDALDQIRANHPEVYEQIAARHVAAGAHLDAAAG